MPRGDHNTNKDTAGMDTSSAIYWNGGTFSDGGTIGKTNTADDSCTNVACHSSGAQRIWGGSAPATCDTCHPYPGSATNTWLTNNGHNVRKDGSYLTHMVATGYNAATDTYDAMVADTTRCGKCHPNVPANHQNSAINLSPAGYAACGGGNFTVNQIETGTTVTCDNVLCHTGKTTPNWW
jgi:predicted CxxxxCH...CXXCH cytochrome family protein